MRIGRTRRAAEPDPRVRERLQRAWLARLRAAWIAINRDELGGALRPPVLIVDGGERRLGRWQRTGRLLGIAESLIWQQPWERVLDTLRHEMAHQYADEVLGADDERPHGDAFRHACRRLGVAPTAAGEPARDPGADRILQRVRKLLSLAGSDNVHEAEAAMAKANTLLLRYNLELPDGDVAPGYGYRRVGRGAAAIPLPWKLIATLLEEFFFVDCIWVTVYNARRDRDERVLELCGTGANLDFAAHVHEVLHRECERLWALHRAGSGGRVGGRAARREFVCGLLAGFGDKLRAERAHNAERGLVWVGDPRLGAYVHQRHPRLRRLGSRGVYLTSSYRAGEQAGRELTIHRPIRERGGGGGGLLE